MCLLSHYAFKTMFVREKSPKKPPKASKRPPKNPLMEPDFAGYMEYYKKKRVFIDQLSYETLEIQSDDGLRLQGYYFPNGDAKKTVLFVHGYRSTGIAEAAQYAEAYYNRGYNLLTFDQRACGASEGKYITFGVLEYIDALRWLQYFKKLHPDHLLVAHGASLGGATVCNLSQVPPEESGLTCIISDCAYADVVDELVYCTRKSAHIPGEPLMPPVSRLFARKTGLSLTETTPEQSVADAKVPVLFFHGLSDNFIPVEHAKRLYEACVSKKDIMLVEGAAHVGSARLAGEAYYEKIFNFIEECENTK